MAIKKKLAVPIDSSNFLWALKCKISSTRSAPFDFNSQQDVVEILKAVFDELKGTSVRTDDLLSNTLRTTITCNSCFCSSVRGEKLDIVSVSMTDSVIFEDFLPYELLTSENEWFCQSCHSFNENIKNMSIIQSAPILVIHDKRFCVERGKVVKDDHFFKCLSEHPLQIQIIGNEVSFLNNYPLVARINHSCSLNNRHYRAIIKHVTSNQWFSWNDKVVFYMKTDYLNNNISCLLFFFFEKIILPKFKTIFLLLFTSDLLTGCDNPKLNLSVFCGF